MNQKFERILDYGGNAKYTLCTDFAYHLFMVGLENKSIFLDQYLKDFEPIRQPKDKENRFSNLEKKLIRRNRKRKKRSKKQCKFCLGCP